MTDDPFIGCELDEIMAIIFDHAGPAGLKELLAKVELDRESLTRAADKLRAAGLIEAANVVAGAAARAADPMASEIAAILSNPIEGNRKSYLAAMYRHDRLTMTDLVANAIDPDTLDYVARSKVQRNVRFRPKSGHQ